MQSVSGQKLRQRSLHSIILLIPDQEINFILFLFLQQRSKSPARRDVTHWLDISLLYNINSESGEEYGRVVISRNKFQRIYLTVAGDADEFHFRSRTN